MAFDVALAGAGNAAELHAHAVDEVSGASLVGVASRTERTGRAFADDHGCAWHPGVEELLDAETPDVLAVCTPSGAHLEPTLAAAERGVHVLCEKPMEVTTDRIDRMRRAAEGAGVRLGGVFQQRFNPVVRTVRDAAAEGRFGDLSVVAAHVPWWREDDYYRGSWKGTPELDGGGALMNQSIHGVDAMLWFAATAAGVAGNPVEEVVAYTATTAHDADLVEVEDTAVAAVRYGGGALGQVLGATSMYPGSLKRLQVAGRDGTAEIREDELVTWRFREERDDDDAVRERFTTTETGGGAADPMDVDYDNHARNLRAFLGALAEDEPYLLDAAEARKAVAVVEAIYESADAGRPVAPG